MEHLVHFTKEYLTPSIFISDDKSIHYISDYLFKKLNTIKENEENIRKLLLICSPLPPYIKQRKDEIKRYITYEMIIEVLNSYIADGGNRDFKSILNPDSEVSISDSEPDIDDEELYNYLENEEYSD